MLTFSSTTPKWFTNADVVGLSRTQIRVTLSRLKTSHAVGTRLGILEIRLWIVFVSLIYNKSFLEIKSHPLVNQGRTAWNLQNHRQI